MKLSKNQTLCECYLAFALSGMGSLLISSLLPTLRETYTLSYAFSGLLLSAQPIGNLLSIFLAGVLPSYIGRRRTVLLLTCWMPLAYALFSFTASPSLLLLSCFFTGLARGGAANFSNTVVSTLADTPSSALNLLHGFFALGALLAPFLLLAANYFLPAGGFRIATLGMMLFAMIQFSFFIHASSFQIQEPSHFGLRNASHAFFYSSRFWRAGAILFFYISAEYAITSWLITYMKDSDMMNEFFSQMIGSILWLCILCGRIINARFSYHLSQNLLLIINGLGFLCFFWFLLRSTQSFLIVLNVVGLGLFMAGIYPITFALVNPDLRGNDLAASILTLSGSIGGILAPALIGHISEQYGISGGMQIVVLFTLGTFLLILSLTLPTHISHRHSQQQH